MTTKNNVRGVAGVSSLHPTHSGLPLIREIKQMTHRTLRWLAATGSALVARHRSSYGYLEASFPVEDQDSANQDIVGDYPCVPYALAERERQCTIYPPTNRRNEEIAA